MEFYIVYTIVFYYKFYLVTKNIKIQKQKATAN